MMVKRSKSELNLTSKQSRKYERRREKEQLKENRAKMNSLVKSLECSLYESQLQSLKSAGKERKSCNKQMDDAKKENKQLLNVLQQQCSNHEAVRTDISPSYSTVSMVHLQYKYEELLSSHEGLLKLLESKVKEVRKCYAENEQLHHEIKALKRRADDAERSAHAMCDKYVRLRQRKERKAARVKFERDTIKIAHDKLVRLLHRKCMEQDDQLLDMLQRTAESSKCLLIAEIRRANQLQYENALMRQENAYLRVRVATARARREKSKE